MPRLSRLSCAAENGQGLRKVYVMARCEQPNHMGGREVARIKIFQRDGKMNIGCVSCIEPLLTNLYPTDKRWRINSGGKDFKISPAHVRDIRMRRCAPDLSGTWRDNKGVGDKMRY